MSIIGDWTINYIESSQTNQITFYADNSFYQKQGRYTGSWLLNSTNNNLILKFPSIILKDDASPYLILDLCVNNCFNQFSGIKDNKNYPNGALHIKADKISDTPTPISELINSYNIYINNNKNNSEDSDSSCQNGEDSDSPCQKRKNKNRKNRN